MSLSVLYLGHFLDPQRQQAAKYTKGSNATGKAFFIYSLRVIISLFNTTLEDVIFKQHM